MRPQLLPLALALLLAPGPRADDLAERLGDLTADRAAVRAAAERWIAARATPGDFPALAGAASGGGAEVRVRLARALSSTDRHLSLAALFLSDGDPELQALGRRIVRQRVSRANPDLGNPGETGRALGERLITLGERSIPAPLAFTPGATLGDSLEVFSLRGRVPLALVVDPEVAESLPDSREVLEGSWSGLVALLASRHSVGLEVHGFDLGDEEDVAGGFLAFAPRTRLGRRSGDELLAESFEVLVRSRDPQERSLAARNLAATGWSGALHWMGERLLEDEDPEVLEGLLWAALRGHRVLALSDPGRVARLVDRFAADLEAGVPRAALRAELLVEAFAGNGLAADGSSLAPALLGTGSDPRGAGHGLRLALGLSCGVAGSGVESFAAKTLASTSAAPTNLALALELWLQAAPGRGAPALGAPAALLSVPADPEEAFRLALLLEETAATLPDAWRDPQRVPATDRPGRLLVLEHWLRRGEADVAARHLEHLLDSEQDLSRSVRRLAEGLEPRRRNLGSRGLTELMRAAGQLTRTDGERPMTELAVRLDLVSNAETQAFLASRAEEDGLDLRLLGLLASRGEAREAVAARRQLESEVSRAAGRQTDPRRLEPLLEALELTVERLLERREDELALTFAQRILTRSRSYPVLARALDSRGFPAPPRLGAADLDRPRRRLPR